MALKTPSKRTSTKVTSEVKKENAGKQEVLKKIAPPTKRKPTPPKPAPKEVKPSGKTQKTEPKGEKPAQPAVAKSEPRASEATSKPVITSQRQDTPSRPRQTDTREDFERHEKQITMDAMNKLSYAQKMELWKELNAQAKPDEFFTIRTPEDLPYKVALRLDEAILRKVVDPKPSNRDALYCPYCVAWQPFKVHSWSGYKKCCGCSISTHDFYTRADNDLFTK